MKIFSFSPSLTFTIISICKNKTLQPFKIFTSVRIFENIFVRRCKCMQHEDIVDIFFIYWFNAGCLFFFLLRTIDVNISTLEIMCDGNKMKSKVCVKIWKPKIWNNQNLKIERERDFTMNKMVGLSVLCKRCSFSVVEWNDFTIGDRHAVLLWLMLTFSHTFFYLFVRFPSLKTIIDHIEKKKWKFMYNK